MFRRVRIIANGSAVLEDIEEYGRVFQLFSELLPPQRRFNNMAEAWGRYEHKRGAQRSRPNRSYSRRIK